MSQQSGYYKSKSQVKNSFDLKPKRTYQKIQRKTHSVNNPPGKGQLKEQTYSKVDKHHNGYQLTQNLNPIQKSEENLVKDNKVSRIFSSESSPVPDVSYLRNSVSFNSQSNRNIHYAFKGSSNEVKVNHSGEIGFQSNHTKTNVLSLVERNLDMEKRFVDQNYKLKESGGVCLDQSFTTEIHPTEESDNDYSSDFSDECSSISSIVPSKTEELLSVGRPNNHKEMTGICESVLTTRTSGFTMPVKVIGSTNDGMDMKAIDFEQSNRLPSHHYIFSNVKRRAKDLLKLVCLSLNEFTNVFELKPIDGYGFYILHSNKCKNWNHCYVQTNDDAFHREVQTEPIDISHDVWTQQPSDENGEFCGRVGSNNNSHINGSYNLSYSNDFNHVSSKTILHELAKEFCLGVNTYNTTVNDEVEHVTNTFSINEFNTPGNSTSMMNPNHRLPNSLLENLQLMLNLINEETLANLSYLSKESITDQNDLQSTENDFVEIFFQLKDDCFSVESKFDRGYNDIQNKELQNTPSKNNVTTVNANEISKLQSFSYFWENYECVACDCAPQNQTVILTIHRPVRIPPSLTENSLKFQTEKNNWNLSNRLNNKVITTCLAITEHGNFLIGCSNGQIIHRGRTPNQTVYPKLFSRILCCSAVQTVETHPDAELHIFIAGYTDGKICLYKTNYFQPVLEWDVTSSVPITNLSKIKLTKNKDDTVAPISESISKISVNRSFISIRKLIWSATRSSVFFSLDSNNQIILWDIVNIFNLANNSLLLNDTESSLKNDYPINVNLNDKKILSCQINDICISKMSCSRNINRISSSSIAPISTHSSPLFILFYPHKISIHWINSRWINESVNENTLLMKTLDNFSSIS
ncbi:unnamed protein product [Schistosoma guineensis]|nr:unnamed protein product [Schistosoma guineensis]